MNNQSGSKFKPLVIIQSYEERDYNRFSLKTNPIGSSTVTEALQKVALTKQNGTSSSTNPPPPPPPPPLGNSDGKTTSNVQMKEVNGKPWPKQPPPVPVKYSTLSSTNKLPLKNNCQRSNSLLPDENNSFTNGTVKKQNIYAKPSPSSSQLNGTFNGMTKIQSCNGLASPKVNGNDSTTAPKCPPPPPPPAPSNKSENSTTLKRRPVSVVIGEYPSDSLRRQPGKLGFLQNNFDEIDRSSQSSGDSISSQLASELAQTLNRSNLRRKTESVENLSCSRISSKSNGTVTISVGSNLIRNFARSTDNLLDDRESKIRNKSNRVTISILGPENNSDFSNNFFRN